MICTSWSSPLFLLLDKAKFTEDQLLLTNNSWLASLALPLYGIGTLAPAKSLLCPHASYDALRYFCNAWLCRAGLVLLVGTSHFGMMFSNTSAIFYVVIDTIMLISLRKHLGQVDLKSMVFALFAPILLALQDRRRHFWLWWVCALLLAYQMDETFSTRRAVLHLCRYSSCFGYLWLSNSL